MRSLFALFGLSLLIACGGNHADPTPPSTSTPLAIELGASGGNTLRAVAGSTTYVYITVIGVGGRQVSFQSSNLPSFAQLSAEGMLTLQPPPTVIGEFNFTLSATVGDETASKDVQLTVDRPNTAPVLVMPVVRDPRGFQVDFNPMEWDCMLNPYLEVTARDFDRDPIGLEVVATPTQGSLAPTLRFNIPAREAGGFDGTYVAFYHGTEVKLTGMAPGVPYVVSLRAVDALGAASGWASLQPITCLPFGINLADGNALRWITLSSGTSRALSFIIQGSFSEPVVLSTDGLPSFARLNGMTLSFEPPTVTTTQYFDFKLLATSGGVTSKAKFIVELRP